MAGCVSKFRPESQLLVDSAGKSTKNCKKNDEVELYRYYLSKIVDKNDEYLVHILYCPKGVELEDRENLGFHLTCKTALERARGKHPDRKINGCERCCPDCHH